MSIVRPRSAAEPWRLVLAGGLLLLLLLLLQACAAPPPPAPSTSPPAPPTAEAAALGGRMTADAQEYPWSALGRLNLARSEEHTSELQSLMRISYAVFCLKKKKKRKNTDRRRRENKKNKYVRSEHIRSNRPNASRKQTAIFLLTYTNAHNKYNTQ